MSGKKKTKVSPKPRPDKSQSEVPIEYDNPGQQAIYDAFLKKLGHEKADELAFHLRDWLGDAKFLVELHDSPEKFKKREIVREITNFVVHVPYHVNEAAKILRHD